MRRRSAHAGVCKASQWETVCVSVSLSGMVINNAWLWEDERLFWLEACVSYGARDISACNFNYTSEGARGANVPPRARTLTRLVTRGEDLRVNVSFR